MLRKFSCLKATIVVIVIAIIIFISSLFPGNAGWVEESVFFPGSNQLMPGDYDIDGNTMIFFNGFYRNPSNSKELQEIGEVYTYNGEKWSQQAKLLIPSENPKGYAYNSRTAIDGDTALFGVSIFTRKENNWSFQTQLQPPIQKDWGLVIATALDGDTVAIVNQRKTHVFRRKPDTGAWLFEAELDEYGSVAIDGDTIVIGGNKIFQRNYSGRWLESTTLNINGQSVGGYVDISGDTIVVGKPRDFGRNWRGSAYVFERNPANNVWSYKAKLEPNDVPNFLFTYGFGGHIAISGNTIVVGIRIGSASPPLANFRWTKRSVYVFTRNSWGGWSLQAKPKPHNYEQIADRFAGKVSISGNRIFVNGDGLYTFRKDDSP